MDSSQFMHDPPSSILHPASLRSGAIPHFQKDKRQQKETKTPATQALAIILNKTKVKKKKKQIPKKNLNIHRKFFIQVKKKKSHHNSHCASTASNVPIPTIPGTTTAVRNASDVVVYTKLKPMVDEFWHMPAGIGSSCPGSTKVISAQL